MADPGVEEWTNDDGQFLSDSNMETADNECAQALLALAHSTGPLHFGSTRVKCEHQLVDLGHSCQDEICSDSLQTSTLAVKQSILKCELESCTDDCENNASRYSSTLDHNHVDCQMEFRADIIKRIRLDHNYASNNTEKSFLDDSPGKGNGRADLSYSQPVAESHQGEQKCQLRTSNNNPKSIHGRKVNNERSHKNKAHSSKSAKHKETLLPNNSCVDGCCRQQTSGFATVKSEKENVGDDLSLPILNNLDLYQPDDSKYKNFNLLLKCLTTADAFDEKSSSRGERCDSNGNTNDASFSSEESTTIPDQSLLAEGGGKSEYQCASCLKKFQKKRYLTKHIRRMHPETQYHDTGKDDLVSCPNCSHTVPRGSFKKHSNTCNAHTKKSKKQLEMDLANCQFCGIRMRRHILVKHLAQEHCVENCRDFPGLDEDMESDSDESTISGSEHDVDDVELASPTKDMGADLDITGGLSSHSSEHFPNKQISLRNGLNPEALVTCQLCNTELSNSQLPQHLSDDHCVKPPSDVKDTGGTRGQCSHSMLERFLSESSDGGGDADARLSSENNEECQCCVERLVSCQTGARDAAVSDQPCATASCTIFVGNNQGHSSGHVVTEESIVQHCQSNMA